MSCEARSSDQLELRLLPHARRFNRELSAFINPRLKSDPVLLKDVEYAIHIAAPLRERAFVVTACGRACGVPRGLLRHVALATELMMIGALTCDDVIDGSPRRSGIQSLTAKVGPKRARLASEVILHLALEAIASAVVADGRNLSKAYRAFAKAGRILYSGEYLSLHSLQRPDLTPSQIDHLAYTRGGILLEVACSAPAVLVGNRIIAGRLSLIGSLLGSALQHRNDLIDFISDAEVTGKETFEDVLSGQPNLVLSYLFHGSSALRKDLDCARRLWRCGLVNRRKAKYGPDIKRLSLALNESGAIHLAQMHLNKNLDHARRLIEQIQGVGHDDLILFTTAIGDLD